MDIIDLMLEYRKTGNVNLLLSYDLDVNKENLNVIVVEILSWLKLEYKRYMWMQQGKKMCTKPLKMNLKYSWCVDLCKIVEDERLFNERFQIKHGEFDFLDNISERDKLLAREKAFKNYNPQKHT